MAIDSLSIGKRIKRYRTDKDLSQEDLARAIHVSGRHVSSIETVAKAPSLELLILIANALSVSADDLVTDSLTYSRSPANSEIHDLLLDCNHDEKEMLIRILTFLKALFSEFGI